MKKQLLTTIFSLFVSAGMAQWNNSANNYTTGSVTLGANTTPRGRLDIASGDVYLSENPNAGANQTLYLPGHIFIAPHNGANISFIQARRLNSSGTTSLRFRTTENGVLTEAIHIEGNGYTGIGVTAPTERLAVAGNISFSVGNSIGLGTADKFTYDGKNVGNYTLGWFQDSWQAGAPTGYLSAFGGFKIFTNSVSRFSITSSGNVGIGTDTPGTDKLAVNGTVHAREVRVDTNFPPPDYVFEASYELTPLPLLEAYLKQNHHLPEVPSAAEFEKDGINVGDMNMLLLKKVEELTLHIIELKKANDKLMERITHLEEGDD